MVLEGGVWLQGVGSLHGGKCSLCLAYAGSAEGRGRLEWCDSEIAGCFACHG